MALQLPALSLAADGDQSDQYQYYLNEGIRNFERHDDRAALHYFILAGIYNPEAEQPEHYLDILNQRGVMLEPLSRADQLIGYQYYFNKGVSAFERQQNSKALRYFNLALIFDPYALDPDKYIDILTQKHFEGLPSGTAALPGRVSGAVTQPSSVYEAEPIYVTPPVSVSPAARTSGTGTSPQIPVYGVSRKPNEPPVVVSLYDLAKSPQVKTNVQLILGTSLIIEGKNIQRFLIVDDNLGVIRVKTISRDQIQIDSLKYGSTFLHIWDDAGRWTLYVGVTLPNMTAPGSEVIELTEHAEPFRFKYYSDWGSYYFGPKFGDMERQSYSFLQTWSMTGETPYGFLDGYLTYNKSGTISEVSTYSVGLSDIPVPGTNDFDLRGFDGFPYLTQFVMPRTLLRGGFADVVLFDDVLGLSVGGGRKIATYGFISAGNAANEESYVNFARIILFPKSETQQYSLNYARGYGAHREAYLDKEVYSIEGTQPITEDLTFKGELARTNDGNNAGVSGLTFQRGNAMTSFNFRDVSRNFTTISTLPGYQGEIGGTWVAALEGEKFSGETILDVFRDRLNANPSNPDGLNYDANGRLRYMLTSFLSNEAGFYYADEPQQFSPRRNLQVNDRFSLDFPVWGERYATVYAGGGYQKNRYGLSSVSNYDRYLAMAGLRFPLSNAFSTFANYEYSWVHEKDSGEDLEPNHYTLGLSYHKQFTPKVSVTSDVTYRREQGVNGINSFLAGEDSVGGSVGVAYNPVPDVSVFGDARTRRVWPHASDNPSYNDLDIRIGVRLSFAVFPGIDPHGKISGIVFKDKNGNGHWDADEPGIEGVKVKVGDKEAVSDKDGWFRIDMRAKSVVVTPVMESAPAGFILSTPASAKVKIIQGSGGRADFGFISQTGVYGVVFVDNNGNGAPDGSDQFLGRIKISLDGQTTQVTDAHGAYSFKNVTAGAHTVSLDLGTLPVNMIPLIKLRNDIEVTEGTTYIFHVPMRLKPESLE